MLTTDIVAGVKDLSKGDLEYGLSMNAASSNGWAAVIDPVGYNEQRTNIDNRLAESKEEMSEFVKSDWYDSEKFLKDTFGDPEAGSVFDTKLDSLAQSGGQLGATIGISAIPYVGPYLATALTGATAFGRESENAFKNGATYEEAVISSAVAAVAEVAIEKVSGSIKIGKAGTLDDILTKKISNRISNNLLRALAKTGMDVTGEGAEEVITGYVNDIAQKLTYMDEKEWSDVLSWNDERWEEFIGGAVLGGIASGGRNTVSAIKGVDPVTGLNKNEQTVADKVAESRIADAEKDGTKLTVKEKGDIREQVRDELEKGYIGTNTIEEILAGDEVKAYKDAYAQEEADIAEYESLLDTTYAERTERQTMRLDELKSKIGDIKDRVSSNAARAKLDELMAEHTKGSKFLAESYNQRELGRQRFTADLSQVDKKYHDTYQRAMDSGVVNNNRRSHEFVELVAKISAEKGIAFDFSNNQRIKESGFAVQDAIVNGYVSADGSITINMQSPKYWQSTVGHEVTHVLEGTELYDSLKSVITEYAKTKGEYQSRLDAIKSMYKKADGYDGEDFDIKAEKELVADLVGEYLFQDSAFVDHLLNNNRNVFQKIWDEVKYFAKTVMPGSKEHKQILAVQRAFEKAWRSGGKGVDGGVRMSLENVDGIDYVKAEKNVFTKEDGTQASERDIFNSLVGKVLHLPDGDVEIVNRLPGGKDMYNELYRRYPRNLGGIGDPKQLNSDVNHNMEELIGSSETIKSNEPDYENKHEKHGITSFDTRTVKFYDGSKAYDIEFSIAKLENGKNVAYAKKFFGYDAELTKKIQTAEGRSNQSPFNQQSVSEGIIPQAEGNVNRQSSADPDVRYSLRVSDPETIEFLENQEHITTYKAMQVVDGKLYPPMAGKVKGENGRYQWTNPSELGVWQQATEDPANIKKVKNGVGYYTLNKGDGTSVDAAYNPYEHSSNLVLNDQFESAYRRDNLVTVECVIPASEMTSGYKADYAKDGTGVMDWKSGVVAGQIQDNKRQVYLSRYLKPVRILSEAETAAKYKEVLDGTGVAVPFNVVSPSLLSELEKVGVDIDYEGSPNYRYHESKRRAKEAAAVQYSLSDSDGNTLTNEQSEYFKDSKVRDDEGNLKVMYHGSRSEAFSTFDLYEGVWLTTDPRYAEVYAGQWHSWRDDLAPVARTDLNGLEPEVYSDPDYRVYKMYANIKNPADIGELDIPLSDDKVRQLAMALGIRYNDLKPLADTFMEEQTYMLTRSKEFMEIASENGFDGLKATEKGRETWCAFATEDQVKLTSNKTPTSNPDVRYSLSEDVKKAEEYFGTTYNIHEAGYLLTDGKYLDFSGKHEGAPGGYRTVDHRDSRSSESLSIQTTYAPRICLPISTVLQQISSRENHISRAKTTEKESARILIFWADLSNI